MRVAFDIFKDWLGRILWKIVMEKSPESSLIFQVSLTLGSGMANPSLWEIKERWQKDAWKESYFQENIQRMGGDLGGIEKYAVWVQKGVRLEKIKPACNKTWWGA